MLSSQTSHTDTGVGTYCSDSLRPAQLAPPGCEGLLNCKCLPAPHTGAGRCLQHVDCTAAWRGGCTTQHKRSVLAVAFGSAH